MKKVVFLALLVSLVGCARFKVEDGKDGSNGFNGTNGSNGSSPVMQTEVMTLNAFRGGPNFVSTLSSERYVQIPNSLFAAVEHTSGSPGWISLVVADKTFCYQAPDSNSTLVGKRYDLKAVRSGNDISCTTGNSTNTTYSSVEYALSGSQVQLTIHTPRINNGVEVIIELDTFFFN